MKQSLTSIFIGNLRYEVANLFPSYFALIMATGIISIACDLIGMTIIAKTLFYLNVIFYCVLWGMLICRLIFYYKNCIKDSFNHARSPGFLTVVAGTNVLGSQVVILHENYRLAVFFYFVGFVLWLSLIYFFVAMITVRRGKPTLEKGMNGIWLLMVVATQSMSILGVQLYPHLPFPKEVTLFLSLILFLIGCMLYIIVITLIFYRLTFFELRAEEFAPPYWINMGAVAIITLAGSFLMLNVNQWDFLQSLNPFLKGYTLMFWAIGTWWIPLIVVLGAWRHFYQLIPIKYHPQYWGMVFPIGMYAVCTFRLAEATNIQFLNTLPPVFVYAGLFAWVITLLGLCSKIIGSFYIIRKA